MRMRQGLAGLAFVTAILFAGGQAFAESAGDPASAVAPKCLKAEVNPVTGHALCIDPIGAPVDPPPAAELPPASRMSAATKLGATAQSAKAELRFADLLSEITLLMRYRASRYLSAFWISARVSGMP